MLVHSDIGPLLVGCWYRPPNPGNIASITGIPQEILDLEGQYVAKVLIGDCNVHNKRWLQYSSKNSPEGDALFRVAGQIGCDQIVSSPTRGKHLLDLVLTDMRDASATVLPAIADHSCVLVSIPLLVHSAQSLPRQVWDYSSADWVRLEALLHDHNWNYLVDCDPSAGAEHLTQDIMGHAHTCISQRFIRGKRATHPWLTPAIENLVKLKNEAVGTAQAKQAAETCSKAIAAAYKDWVSASRQKLLKLKKGSKQWWTTARRLLEMKQVCSTIPSMKGQGEWISNDTSKANAFADHFSSKFNLPAAEHNDFSELAEVDVSFEPTPVLNQSMALSVLLDLDETSGTGPDQLAARVLKRCAHALAKPVLMLAVAILDKAIWPRSWKLHWVLPLHKKDCTFFFKNYRGIHLTPQLSKVIERLIGKLFRPHLQKPMCCGENQFAYLPERGCRDALLFLMLRWLQGFQRKSKFAFYCSDVSGAFDRVDHKRLMLKLSNLNLPAAIVRFIDAWLSVRTASIIINGQASNQIDLRDMLFQGTVLGPTLWNTFYADSSAAIRQAGFSEIVFADDLNAFKEYPSSTPLSQLQRDMGECQASLHQWGRANQVAFDAGKESQHVLSRSNPHGGNFKLLGIIFDPKLIMDDAIHDLVSNCRWKRNMLLRSGKFFCGLQLVDLYKAQLLGFIEYRTPAIYHACCSLLAPLDEIQAQILAAAGMSPAEALMICNLAPLSARRDMAMLGAIHRSVLGYGPSQLHQFFRRTYVPVRGRHAFQLHEWQDGDVSDYSLPGSAPAQYIARSTLGLAAIYNRLPASIVETSSTVSTFQACLQDLMRQRICGGDERWQLLFSPRWALHAHPLVC